jgi:hypothetical protein
LALATKRQLFIGASTGANAWQAPRSKVKKITGKYLNIVLRGYLSSELFYAEANHNNSFIL